MKLKQRVGITLASLVLCTLVLIGMESGVRPLSAVRNAVIKQNGGGPLLENADRGLNDDLRVAQDIHSMRRQLGKSDSGPGSPVKEAYGDNSAAKHKQLSPEDVENKSLPNRTRGGDDVDNELREGDDSRNRTEDVAKPNDLYAQSLFSVLGKFHDTPLAIQPKSYTGKFDDLFKNGPNSNPTPRNTETLLKPYKSFRKVPAWERFQNGITRYALYEHNSPYIPVLLDDLANMELAEVDEKNGGTQVKLIIDYTDGGQALFKPWKVPREYQTVPDHFYFSDIERHNAEIAAFHVDRILDFRRAPPQAGRWLNMTTEIYNLADSSLRKSFFRSPANNLCFVGHCSYYCQTETAVCGHPDMIEGSFAAYLPPFKMAPRKTWRHPWRRSYSKHRKAIWEDDPDYCEVVRTKHPYNSGRRLLDLMDLSVYDFLIGNMDRHHYETFDKFGNFTYPLHLDQGRSFGKHAHDEMSILIPVVHCCLMRKSTYQRLQLLATDRYKLGDVMRDSMYYDKIAPVLFEPHFDALDRRLSIILKTVDNCIKQKGVFAVLKSEPLIQNYREPSPSNEAWFW